MPTKVHLVKTIVFPLAIYFTHGNVYLHNQDNHNGVITHLEPDILESFKWALEGITMNKASGGNGIPANLFKILKVAAAKVLYSICQQIWKTQQWPQDWKRSVFIPIPKKGNSSTFRKLRSWHLVPTLHGK